MNLKSIIDYYFCKDVENLCKYTEAKYREFYAYPDLFVVLDVELKKDMYKFYFVRAVFPAILEATGLFLSFKNIYSLLPFIVLGEAARYAGLKFIKKNKEYFEEYFKILIELEKNREKEWKKSYKKTLDELLGN
ncbi:hypothetical protein HYV79_00405 [Candidatus Woesearchaeota archaeon]|nr:hypothetical protein [Candidatus Woesearchaeota archaeon]